MVYELLAYNTDSRYSDDVRYRRYTTSGKVAERFNKIPKIQFTDSGHGVVFFSREHSGRKQSCISQISEYVERNMRQIKGAEKCQTVK